MENPYSAPDTLLLYDDKIINLLMRYKRQLKVVNMLRAEGMSYMQATSLVNENVNEAQRRLDKKHILWRFTGIILLITSLSALACAVIFIIIHFIMVGLICSTLYGAIVCFQRCEKIKP